MHACRYASSSFISTRTSTYTLTYTKKAHEHTYYAQIETRHTLYIHAYVQYIHSYAINK